MAEQISLVNIGGGAAVEKFDYELERVVKNLLDPNTTDAKRTITLKVKFKPQKGREACDIEIECSSTEAPCEAYETMAYLGLGRSGKPEIYESNPQQMGLLSRPVVPENVVQIQTKKEVPNA